MFECSVKHFAPERRSQHVGDAALNLDRARRAAILRGDYRRAGELRLELKILIALRDATDAEIRSGKFFEE
jgi:hypothetical protein